jgi:hypothetical protein
LALPRQLRQQPDQTQRPLLLLLLLPQDPQVHVYRHGFPHYWTWLTCGSGKIESMRIQKMV